MPVITESPGNPPGFQFDYAEFTALVAITASTEGTAQTIVSGNSVTYDGATAVLIVFFCPAFQSPTSGANTRIVLVQDGSSLGFLSDVHDAIIGNNHFFTGEFSRRLTPAAGAHTYAIAGFNSAAANEGDFVAGAGGAGTFLPGYIRITKA